KGSVAMGGNIARVFLDQVVEVLDRLVVLLLRGIGDATIEVAGRVVWLRLNGIAEGLDGFVYFARALVGETEVVVVVRFLGIGFDCLLKKSDRLFPLLVLRGLSSFDGIFVCFGLVGTHGWRKDQRTSRRDEVTLNGFHNEIAA